MKLKVYLYYFLLALIFVLLLYFGTNLPGAALRVLLKPYSLLTEAFFNHSHVYIEGVGYQEIYSRYILGRDCLGLNFTALFFALTCIPFIRYLRGGTQVLWILACLLGSVLVGFVVNALRILGSVPFALQEKFNMIHASLGIALYLCVLTSAYALLRKIFISGGTHEESV